MRNQFLINNTGEDLFYMNWYDMFGTLENFEDDPAFLEKMAIDDVEPDKKK